MVQTAVPPPIKSEPTDVRLKWWWYLVAVLSLGLLGSRAGRRELAQALCEKARRKQNGGAVRPLTIAADSRGITINPARSERFLGLYHRRARWRANELARVAD
jgi:hypothetical protein